MSGEFEPNVEFNYAPHIGSIFLLFTDVIDFSFPFGPSHQHETEISTGDPLFYFTNDLTKKI
jgi:hypothetical protein